jgi:hypothetical protein
VVNHQSFATEQGVQSRTAKPTPLLGQLPQPLAQGCIVFLLRPISVNRSTHLNQMACLPRTQPKTDYSVGNRLSPRLGL